MKSRKFVVAGDNHGDMQDDESVSALMRFLAEFEPEIRIHAGDNWDFRNIRRGATDDEKAGSLQEDWEAGADFMRRFSEAVTRTISCAGITMSAFGICARTARDSCGTMRTMPSSAWNRSCVDAGRRCCPTTRHAESCALEN